MSKGKVKSLESTARRIFQKVSAGEFDQDQVEHMIHSLLINRDKVIKNLKRKAKPHKLLLNEKAISGALRDCINQHGNITKHTIGSASKRIRGNLYNIIQENQEKKLEVSDVFI